MVDRLAVQPGQAVVAAAVELEHIELLLQERDERQKPLALQPVLVELVRRAVGGRDDHHPGVEQRGEQALEDHRIGDVLDLELVEAQQRRLGRRDRAATLTIGSSVCARRSCSMRSCTSSMKAWKWTRRLRGLGTERKNRSISIDLPRPTGPQR